MLRSVDATPVAEAAVGSLTESWASCKLGNTVTHADGQIFSHQYTLSYLLRHRYAHSKSPRDRFNVLVKLRLPGVP